ncbi:coiled-coil domain-containing protein 83-like isoform X1 [Hydractinia symbiolongicarpus]|uniref:coiled-coil domain-containing protein 83-like isoform X1 n=1 Tax=Hydractinia symbiolongicarpus TaxID=13093 RepID=UPI00254C25F2|nr:coiled-coil domain-containing protein 83-like isoform X1 [Hydractinia symbiolongicarpus]
MPKKKGRKKAKSGNGKKSKETADTWTLKEAVMLYQVEAKEAQANELKENIDNLKLRNDRQKQKNEFLRNEQNRHIKDVVEKARKMEEVSRSQKQTPFEAVEKALEEKLVAIKAEDLHLREVHRQIEVLDEDIEVLSKELQELLNYKEHGQTVDRTHIEVLEKEMRDMETSYAEMKDFFSKSLEVIKCTITKQNEENITKHKELASEGAISNLDKHNGQEFLDNKWLLREVKINRRHIVAVEAEVERLEKESIKVMADLFEQQLEDVKETRQFYLACKEDEEASSDCGSDNEAISDGEAISDRKAIGDRKAADNEMSEDMEDLSDNLKWLDIYYPEFENITTEEEYRLDPMEIKLLCVTGTKVPLHRYEENEFDSSSSTTYKNWDVKKEDLL